MLRTRLPCTANYASSSPASIETIRAQSIAKLPATTIQTVDYAGTGSCDNQPTWRPTSDFDTTEHEAHKSAPRRSNSTDVGKPRSLNLTTKRINRSKLKSIFAKPRALVNATSTVGDPLANVAEPFLQSTIAFQPARTRAFETFCKIRKPIRISSITPASVVLRVTLRHLIARPYKTTPPLKMFCILAFHCIFDFRISWQSSQNRRDTPLPSPPPPLGF